MLHYGANVNEEDGRGYTPLFYASKAGSLSNIIQLIDYGSDINHESKICNKLHDSKVEKTECVTKKTPLFVARSYDTAKLLLKYGANPSMNAYVHNEKTKLTAIEYHIKFNNDASKAILDHSLNWETNEGFIAMDFKIFENQEEEDNAHEMSLFQANDSYQYAAQRDTFQYFFSWY